MLPGGYADHVARREAASAAPSKAPGRKERPDRRPEGPEDKKPDEGKAEHAARRAASREVERKKRRVGELEAAIEKAEADLAALRAALVEDPKGDWATLAERAEQERSASRALDAMLEEWSRLSLEVAGH